MQAVAVSSSEHETTCEFIYYDDLSVFDYVVYVPFHYVPGFQRLNDMVVIFHVLRIADVLYAEKLLALGYAVFRESDFFILFFYGEIFLEFQAADAGVGFLIHICRLVAPA